ncbi:MAG: adenylate/guanylate cyclase domain-containing protein, partial [Chloroflexota bacterium]
MQLSQSSMLQTVASYTPPLLLRSVLTASDILPTPQSASVQGFQAAILFADVSGFTALTESLALKGAEGPEEITRLLNAYFVRMISIIESEGGSVVKFVGDALTVVFPADEVFAEHAAHKEDSLSQEARQQPRYPRPYQALSIAVRRAHQAAETMQDAMSEFSQIDTSVGTIALGMKISIGAGNILAMEIGGELERWEYVIAGDPIRQISIAEKQAQSGEIILSPRAEKLNYPYQLVPAPLKSYADVLADYFAEQAQSHSRESLETIQRHLESHLSAFLPASAAQRLRESMRDWLAELRLISVLFIRLSGIEYVDLQAARQTQEFLQTVQKITYQYEGSVNKLSVDDKGTTLLLLFGMPPFAHEDDPERAISCALQICEHFANTSLTVSGGIATGHIFAGPVGSPTRREYTVLGDAVNLASRMMTAAGDYEVYCDHNTYRGAQDYIEFNHLPPMRVKGKTGLVRTYQPLGLSQESENTVSSWAVDAPETPLIGRQDEIAILTGALDAIKKGKSGIVIIEADAGIGKSRLVGEFARIVRLYSLPLLLGAGRSIEQSTPYRAWRDILMGYLGLDVNNTHEEMDETQLQRQRRAQAMELLTEMLPEQAMRFPLLNDILNLDIPQTEFTKALDPTLRQQNLNMLLLNMFEAWTDDQPLLLVIEDAHWLDSLSWEEITSVVRTLYEDNRPMLLVIATRPLQSNTPADQHLQALRRLDITSDIHLTTLSSDEIVHLVETRLALPVGTLPPELADLVKKRAEGNPFFAEELVFMLRDQGILTVEPAKSPNKNIARQNKCIIHQSLSELQQTLPDTIQGLIMARIDRLPPERQFTLKVGSVIGRTFAYQALIHIIHKHSTMDDNETRHHLDELAKLDLTPLDAPEPELTYIFKHIITQEVSYQTLLYDQRRQLHRSAAEWYEQTYASNLTPYYPLLVYHYHQADDDERELYYVQLAGERAAVQYANQEAITYYTRGLALVPESDFLTRHEMLSARAEIYGLRGMREEQWQDLQDAYALAEEHDNDALRAQAILQQAEYSLTVSDYGTAIEMSQKAIAYAERFNDDVMQAEGYFIWAQALQELSDFETAQRTLKTALTFIYRDEDRILKSEILQELGTSYRELSDYRNAERHYQQSLEIVQAVGDLRRECITLSKIGSIYSIRGENEQAKQYFQQGFSIAHEIGALAHECELLGSLGSAYYVDSDY